VSLGTLYRMSRSSVNLTSYISPALDFLSCLQLSRCSSVWQEKKGIWKFRSTQIEKVPAGAQIVESGPLRPTCTCTHAGVIPATVWVATCLSGTHLRTSHLLILLVLIILWFGILQPYLWSKFILLLGNPAQMADAICTGSQKAVPNISNVFISDPSPEWTSESKRASHSSRWRCRREYEKSNESH